MSPGTLRAYEKRGYQNSPLVRTVALPSHEECLGLIAASAQHMEGSHAPLIAAHRLAVDQAGAHLEVVHGL